MSPGELINRSAILDRAPMINWAKSPGFPMISHLIENGTLANDVGLAPMSRENDHFMLCGSVQMLADIRALLEGMGLAEGSITTPGEFVIEKAFVE